MSRVTLEQKRAKHAWECAGRAESEVKRADSKAEYKDYVNDAKGLPALIMNSGLMQVMAFLHTKGGRHEVLAGHLLDWLSRQSGVPGDFEKFMERMMKADPRTYQRVTTEAFAWLRWLRQMAAAREGGQH